MGAMVQPRTPDWITPSVDQVADEHWLAYAMLRNSRLPWAAGVAAGIAWVRGLRVGPITERDEQPVTRDVADAERWAAEFARDPSGSLPLGLIYQELNVAPVSPKPGLDANYCTGVWRGLRWLLGVPGQTPPLDVPRRYPSGRLYTADDLYRERTRGDDRNLTQEARDTMMRQARFDAAQFLHYDGVIAQIQRDLKAEHTRVS